MAGEMAEQSALQEEFENGRRDLWLKLYAEACENIRATDEASFKLLGFVPSLSAAGTTLLTLGQKWAEANRTLVVLVSAAGLLITFGLFRWEMRNVQKCDRLIGSAAELERRLSSSLGESEFAGPFDDWSKTEAPSVFGVKIGKAKAEKVIYFFSGAAWLIPILAALFR
jgi:hypothetical protein